MAFSNFISEVTQDQKSALVASAVGSLSKLSYAEVKDLSALKASALEAVARACHEQGLHLPGEENRELADRVVAQINGMGFMHELLYERRDLNEVTINPDGSLFVLRKGAARFEKLRDDLQLAEVWRVVDALLAQSGRAVNDASPSVNAKLRRDDSRGFGGARVKILHPAVVPGNGLGFPSINVRLFEPKPVPPEQLIEWDVAPEQVVRTLVELVARQARMLVIGGTATGKTTILSALCSGIPKEERVVKIEDPEEIWIDHPNVVTIEARPALPGASVVGYEVKDGVDDAMRMSPRYLIVGEVRKGDQALALFRAIMSDHPGLTTFHAEGPQAAVTRMGVIMYADAGVRMEGAKSIFAQAMDLVVQIGWPRTADGKPALDPDGVQRRKLLGIWEVGKNLGGGDVRFKQLFHFGAEAMELPSHLRGGAA